MDKNRHGGLFIAFEGLDGSGSTTQSSRLAEHLEKSGFAVVQTKEPTNNLIGGLIRGQLTREWSSGQECLQLLFAADRAHHLEKEIIPALKKGHIVITDRYLFSSIAFGSLGAETAWLKQINDKFILPDISIYLKVSPESCTKRISGSRFEMQLFEELERMRKVSKVYGKMNSEFGIKEINGEQNIDDVTKEVIKIVESKLDKIKKKLARR